MAHFTKKLANTLWWLKKKASFDEENVNFQTSDGSMKTWVTRKEKLNIIYYHKVFVDAFLARRQEQQNEANWNVSSKYELVKNF